jgi:hypothetical protein
MYPMTYNHLVKKRVKSLTLFAPITFKASTLKSLEPPPGLTGDALQVWARKHLGVRGRNFTRLDLDKLIPDILHQLLLTMNRCLNFTTKAIICDPNTELEDWTSHLRECLGITYNTIWIDRKGTVLVSFKGNECKKLRGQSDAIVTCKKHSLFTSNAQRESIRMVWAMWDLIMDDNARTDIHDPHFLLAGNFFLLAYETLLASAAVFGKDFITPTCREIRDQNAFYKLYLSIRPELADCSMEAVEHMNRVEKRMSKNDLQAGGRAGVHGPLIRLMVPNLIIY